MHSTLSSYCALSKDFTSYIIHNLLEGFHKASTYPLHKEKKKKNRSRKKNPKGVSAKCNIINREINKAECSWGCKSIKQMEFLNLFTDLKKSREFWSQT